MSDISAIGAGVQPVVSQSTSMTGTTQQVSQSPSTATGVSTTSVQQSQQTMISSVSSQVDMIVARYGGNMAVNDLARLLIVLALLDQLLQLLDGSTGGSQLVSGSSGQYHDAAIMFSTGSYSSTYMSSSSSIQTTAIQAYQSSATLADQASGAGSAAVVTPTDTQGSLDAGDGGQQLDVTA